MAMATNLKEIAELSGLKYVELEGWRSRKSAGGEAYRGVLCHHTGSYDKEADASDDLSYAKWLALTGRSDLPAPLCNLALSAEGVIYLCAAGNANHGGVARASGPMPAGDANSMYVGIEAMNSGSQGWWTKGVDRAGKPVTQYDAYVRLCAAICVKNGWTAAQVRAHKETSVTGKWDPGLLDMDGFREDIAKTMRAMRTPAVTRMDPASYRVGISSANVLWLKGRLVAHGYRKTMSVKSPIYGRGVKAAVAAFQRAQGWKGSDANGLPGNETLRRLAAAPKKADK